MGKEQGTVKWFNAEKGWGFIKPDGDGADVFVHVKDVEKSGLKALKEGQRVYFDIEHDKKSNKPKAVNLVMSS